MKTLVIPCSNCGRQYPYDSDLIDLCNWCGEHICIWCEPKHEYEECKGRNFDEKKE